MLITGGTAVAGTPMVDTSLPPMARALAERSGLARQAAALVVAPEPQHFEPAPLPNQDYAAPHTAATPKGPALGAGLFRQTGGYRGDGYVQGSTSRQSEQPKRIPLPGITLKVPLN